MMRLTNLYFCSFLKIINNFITRVYVGPPLADITERRTPEWIMNMILNPTEMVQQDPIAKELLAEYLAPMDDQNLTEDQARKILEYFRRVDQQ